MITARRQEMIYHGMQLLIITNINLSANYWAVYICIIHWLLVCPVQGDNCKRFCIPHQNTSNNFVRVLYEENIGQRKNDNEVITHENLITVAGVNSVMGKISIFKY